MAIQSPRYNYLNYGQVMAQAEQFKGMRTRNNILAMDERQTRERIQNEDRARQIKQQVEGMPAQIEQLEAAGLADQAAELRQSYVGMQVNAVRILEGLRESIDETNYKSVRQNLIQAGAIDGSLMPTEYSDDWFREEIGRTKSKVERFTRQWGAEGRIMAQDIVQQDGSILWEGAPYETTGSRSERRQSEEGAAGASIKAADSNAIARAAAELYGGTWDPQTQRFAGLNRQQQQDVLSVAEEAERVYRAAPGLGHRQAVAKAARTKGVSIEHLGPRAPLPTNPNDPAGIRSPQNWLDRLNTPAVR